MFFMPKGLLVVFSALNGPQNSLFFREIQSAFLWHLELRVSSRRCRRTCIFTRYNLNFFSVVSVISPSQRAPEMSITMSEDFNII